MRIFLDILMLAIFILPIIVGLVKGFVYTLLRFGKTLLALIFACGFAKSLGAWIKSKWMYNVVHENIADLFVAKGEEVATEAELAGTIPESIQKTLGFFGMDVGGMASEAVAEGEAVKEAFIESVSHGVSGVASFALAFAILFFGSLLLILLLRPLLDFIVRHIPVIKTCNRLLGAVLGLFWGLIACWASAQIIVGVLGLVSTFDWSKTVLLSFFYRVTPLKWLLQLVVQGIVGVSIL